MGSWKVSEWRDHFPWVKSDPTSPNREPRILGLECGWIYMTWAVLEGTQVLDGAVVLNEDVLEPADTKDMPFVDLVTRRLYGLHLVVTRLLDQWSPTCVADWSPDPTWNGKNTLENYLAFTYRHGQSQGLIKALCFERGIRVMGVPVGEAMKASAGNPEPSRTDVEAALLVKLAVKDFRPRQFAMDDGRQLSDNFAGALAVAYAAQQKIRE